MTSGLGGGAARPAPLDAALLAAAAAAVALVGWRAAGRRRAGSEDYILAGRSLTLPTFVAALVTSFYGGVLGVGEYAYRYGLSNWVTQGLPYYLFALLYAWLLVGKIRARPGLTIPDHVEEVYGRPAAVLAAFLVFLLACPAEETLMLGTLVSWVLRWPLGLSVLAATGAATCFLFAGGMRSEAWTGRLELVLMYGGFALILPAGWLAVGGWRTLAARLPPEHLTWTGGQSPLVVLSWFFIALWTFVDPSFHQRVCSAKDARTARLGIAASVVLWCAFDFMTTAAGLYARALAPGLADPLAAYPALAGRVLPGLWRGLFFAGIAASSLAALGSKSFLAAVSAARDGLGRLRGLSEAEEERWIRRGLAATLALAIAMALAIPSVVALWYTVGSTVIPGLLVLLVSSYFERLRVTPRAATACALSGWLAATGSWAWGCAAPFYPGLGCALLAWGVGRALNRGRPAVPAPGVAAPWRARRPA